MSCLKPNILFIVVQRGQTVGVRLSEEDIDRRGKDVKIRVKMQTLINFAASVFVLPPKIRNERRSSAK